MQSGQKTVLIVLGMAMAAIVLIAWITNSPYSARVWFATLDQGWTTFCAGLLGFGAIAWQTNVGFKNLRKTAADQAKADREAREHQYSLEREADAARERQRTKVLASTLAAEITAIAGELAQRVSVLESYEEKYVKLGDAVPKLETVADILPKFVPLAFEGNVQDLGLLSPSTARDVVEIHTCLPYKPAGAANLLKGAQIAQILRIWIKAYKSWLVEQSHVTARLLSIVENSSDPGPLDEFRRKAGNAA